MAPLIVDKRQHNDNFSFNEKAKDATAILNIGEVNHNSKEETIMHSETDFDLPTAMSRRTVYDEQSHNT